MLKEQINTPEQTRSEEQQIVLDRFSSIVNTVVESEHFPDSTPEGSSYYGVHGRFTLEQNKGKIGTSVTLNRVGAHQLQEAAVIQEGQGTPLYTDAVSIEITDREYDLPMEDRLYLLTTSETVLVRDGADSEFRDALTGDMNWLEEALRVERFRSS